MGVVESHSLPAKVFQIETDTGSIPCMDVLEEGHYHREDSGDPEKSEHFVRVRWLDTLPRDQAFHETGLFGQQNSVCKPASPRWRHTVERLKSVFTGWSHGAEESAQ